MQRGSSVRKAAYPIDTLFIDRWSQRAMTGEALTGPELMVLFEAARWAPSSGNRQPWRILYALRDTPHFATFLDLLNEGNRVWAHRAGALALIVSKIVHEGKPNPTHSYDTGAAWQNLALQGYLKGYAMHGIGGFHAVRAREVLKVPEDYAVEAMVVVGRLADKSVLNETLQARETPNDRKPLEELICEGPFSL
jgi:nitroreductase